MQLLQAQKDELNAKVFEMGSHHQRMLESHQNKRMKKSFDRLSGGGAHARSSNHNQSVTSENN